ncbi:serine protease [Kistimonas asteriae]|uniref:S1 family peptidase n=1 Tax=Kistimonas asteriae TaxID=517724 RepID=UPI0031B7F378
MLFLRLSMRYMQSFGVSVCFSVFLLLVFSKFSIASFPKDTSYLRIIGGRDVAHGKQPWQVSFQDGREHFCGGSLIAPQWILTAAHCLDNYTQESLGEIDIRVNTVKIYGKGNGKSARAMSVHFPDDDKADIALVRLEKPVLNVPYLALADDAAMEESGYPGVLATVSGWGMTREGDYNMPDTLKTIEVPLVPQAYCKLSYDNDIADYEFCAGYVDGGRDACQGDSGAPLIVKHEDNFVQAGIVSWGSGCARPFMFGVYTRVASFTDWIGRVIAGEN